MRRDPASRAPATRWPSGGAAVDAAMGLKLKPGAHLVVTDMRRATAADTVRALAVADTLRRDLASSYGEGEHRH